ncbi:hypothetical protein LC087_13675 [Bacillus carboniphilus]|uniref:Membrane protein YkvI n=1 Tax=Bacillus carboniphilus TaxID=86663 RepID=A0ABY9JTP8_9BACI|nr:hypothetical protein [Bacillus carboniphilus]WLR41878.1 hypothetical protein LC087_13675 [Bacillus carboniphilus]
MLKSSFKWIFLILGTVIGAGYASGRELWQFFGFESGLAILLFSIFFSISCYVVMSISYEEKSNHFFPVLERLIGRKLSYVYDVIILLYLYTTTVVMIAGGGATLQLFSIPYWGGVVLFCIPLILLFFWDVKGLFRLNNVIIPILIVGLVFILVSFQLNHPHSWNFQLDQQYKWPSAFTFTSLNILSLIAVLSAIGKEMKGKTEAKIVSITSGVILGGLSFLYNESLLQVANLLVDYEIPLFAILHDSPITMLIAVSAMLLFAIFTTAVSGVFGMATRFKGGWNLPLWMLAFLFVLLMIPFTKFGFATLVTTLYPLFALVNLYLLVAILLFPITKRYK